MYLIKWLVCIGMFQYLFETKPICFYFRLWQRPITFCDTVMKCKLLFYLMSFNWAGWIAALWPNKDEYLQENRTICTLWQDYPERHSWGKTRWYVTVLDSSLSCKHKLGPPQNRAGCASTLTLWWPELPLFPGGVFLEVMNFVSRTKAKRLSQQDHEALAQRAPSGFGLDSGWVICERQRKQRAKSVAMEGVYKVLLILRILEAICRQIASQMMQGCCVINYCGHKLQSRFRAK